jgi:hypothetical protein
MDYLPQAYPKVSVLGFPPFWQTANGFDTWIDYLEARKVDRASDSDKKEIDAAFDFLATTWVGRLNALKDCWFDDFGWWTIAAEKAARKPFFTDEQKQLFENISKECWNRFHDNAPNVWRNAPEILPLKSADPHVENVPKVDWQPAAEGGVWNEYWRGTKPGQGPNDGDPTAQTSDCFHGVQNTVTNLLYLISALRRNDTDAADREYGFLYTWFDFTGGVDEGYPLIDRDPLIRWLEADSIVIRERVSLYKNGKGDYKSAPKFDKDAFWLGDQGLLIGALVDRSKYNKFERGALVKAIGALLKGVASTFVSKDEDEKFQFDNYVGDFFTPTGPGGDYRNDYKTGASVFWRYVLYAWNDGEDMKQAINNSNIRPVLTECAAAAALRPLAAEPEDFADRVNDIATLVAAHAILSTRISQ